MDFCNSAGGSVSTVLSSNSGGKRRSEHQERCSRKICRLTKTVFRTSKMRTLKQYLSLWNPLCRTKGGVKSPAVIEDDFPCIWIKENQWLFTQLWLKRAQPNLELMAIIVEDAELLWNRNENWEKQALEEAGVVTQRPCLSHSVLLRSTRCTRLPSAGLWGVARRANTGASRIGARGTPNREVSTGLT